MELYKELAKLRCFNRAELIQITGSVSSADWAIRNYLSKGYIERVRRDLYTVISIEDEQPLANRFQIASHVSDDAFISHHTAFEYYGFTSQVFYEVYISTKKRIRSFNYEGISYLPVTYRGNQGVVKLSNGIQVTSLERTVIDSIADFDRIGGLEELIRCIALIPSLDEKKLLEALMLHNQSQLYQKAGFILEAFNDELALPKSFFFKCEKNISDSKTYLFNKRDDFVLHKKWKLYAPLDLLSLIEKGTNKDVTI